MESGPSKIITLLIPPACREEVLGDLQEESASMLTFFVTLIHVLRSRIRRTSDPIVLLMELLALYTAFVVTASWIDRAMLLDTVRLLEFAVPPGTLLFTIMLADAYSDPKTLSPYKPLRGVVLGTALAIAAGMALLPRELLLIATAFSAILLMPIRLMFRPERPQAAKIPADWQKVELLPVDKWTTAVVLIALLLLFVVRHLGAR